MQPSVTVTSPAARSATWARPADQAIGGLRFDWLMTLLASWLVGGIYLDGWAHTHGQVDDSFFTPWHGLLYTGLLVNLVVLGATLALGRRRGQPWRRALPVGYGWSLVGALIFAGGGGFDLIWHTLFGIEVGVEALVSPAHLVLGLGIWLLVGGPLRAAWARPGPLGGWARQAPAILSAAFLLSVLTFFIQIAHPIPNPDFFGGRPAGPTWLAREMGLVSLLFSLALPTGLILLLAARWRLLPGALTLLLTLNGALMSLVYDGDTPQPLVLGLAVGTMVAAGLVADGLLAGLRPSPARPGALRAFATAVPMAVVTATFAAVGAVAGLWWSVHLWAGSIVLAGVGGLLLSYLVVPPIGERGASPEGAPLGAEAVASPADRAFGSFNHER
jgi:hypothetical protein